MSGVKACSVFSTIGLAAAPIRLADLPSLSLELDRSDLPQDTFAGDSSSRLVQTDFSDLFDLGLASLSHPDIFSSPILNSSHDGETRGAIFHLQRNGENRGGVERVSFGSQNGEQQSSSSFSRGVVARVSFKYPSLFDAFGFANWGTALEYFEVLC